MELVDDTIETKSNGASFKEELGRPALREAERSLSHHEQESRSLVGVGSLVTLQLIEQDREVSVYISNTETNVSQLAPSLQDQLPERTSVHPLQVTGDSTTSKKVTANLAERLEGRSVGETIELLNHAHAKIIEVVSLDISS